ncbi:hypothetical protein LINPERHAP2_LOCUS32280 [Linum perenne]
MGKLWGPEFILLPSLFGCQKVI